MMSRSWKKSLAFKRHFCLEVDLTSSRRLPLLGDIMISISQDNTIFASEISDNVSTLQGGSINGI